MNEEEKEGLREKANTTPGAGESKKEDGGEEGSRKGGWKTE